MSTTTDQTQTPNQTPNPAKEATMTDTRVVPNWDYVLAAKFGAKDQEMKKGLQQLLDTLGLKPELMSFTDEETAKASPLGQKLATLPISLPKGQTAKPPMYRLLSEQVAANAEHVQPDAKAETPNTDDDAAKAALKARAEAEIAKARENALKRQAAKTETLAVFGQFATAKPISDEDAKRAQIVEKMKGYVLGQACVDQNSRPKALVLNGKELDVIFGTDFVAKVAQATRGGSPESFVITCPWCDKKYTMEDQGMRSQPVFKDKKMVRDEKTNRPVFAIQAAWMAQVVYFAARTAEYTTREGKHVARGAHEYLYIKGDRKGQLKKQATLCCYDCWQIARELWEEVRRDRVRTAKAKAQKDGQDEKAAGDAAFKAAKDDGPNASSLRVNYGTWAAQASDDQPGRTVFVGPDPDDERTSTTPPPAPADQLQAAQDANPRRSQPADKGERENRKSQKTGTHGHESDESDPALAGNPATKGVDYVDPPKPAAALTSHPRIKLGAASLVASASPTDKK